MSSLGGGPDHPVVIAPRHSRLFRLPQGAQVVEPVEGSPGATYPRGFLGSGVSAGLKSSGRPDVGVLAVAPEWRSGTTSAAVFTTNAFAAAPVVIDRSECDLGHLRAVAMNSGNANACTGETGLEVARAMRDTCAVSLRIEPYAVAVGSTGIIGVQLDGGVVTEGVKRAAAALRPDGGPEFNTAILTTDRFPKICALSVETPQGEVRLGVCGKGAGMLAPAMATMLCVVTTDAVLTPQEADALLREAVESSYNQITVDSEMSTNDSVFMLCSGASGVRPARAGMDVMAAALRAMLLRTALMMVADGEGATKVIRLQVASAESEDQAVKVARAVAGSPLVKTAMHGADPNWGRIVSSAGAALAGRSLPRASLRLCGAKVFENAAACELSRAHRASMSEAMTLPEVEIVLDLGLGTSAAELFFSDMGHQYITINAEYHT